MKTFKRQPAVDRKIDSLVLPYRINEEMRKLMHEPEWRSGKEDGITLAKYPHMRVVLVALKENTNMHEHMVRGPMSLFVISGNVTLLVEKKKFHLKEQCLFTMKKAVLHEIFANSNSVILMTIMAL
jgi:quercetin dioxygenase-like cupin family protein